MGTELTRKLATIQRIEEIRAIEGADAIQAYRVLGWWVVDKKDAYKVGDLVIYLEIDSWVPHEFAAFLSKGNEPREYFGVKGERLRTVKLRGQVSQGLFIPLEILDGLKKKLLPGGYVDFLGESEPVRLFEPGTDLTGILGIQKWEPTLAANLQGTAKGNFPTQLIPKTDQERIQNCFGEIQKRAKRLQTEKVWNAELQRLDERPTVVPEGFAEPTYEVTLKLDGSSCTIFRWENELRVCSRNLELKLNDENAENSFVKMALQLVDKIPNGFAMQGELMGPGIQGNRENFKEAEFFVFDIYDMKAQRYLTPEERRDKCEYHGLKHVPVLSESLVAPESVATGLTFAEGPSIAHPIREGLVWKCNEDPTFSFKTIANNFLLKEKN
jgi:RNA ligase (TIGR02306 family)